jgi:hypothetical protein
MVSEVTKIRSQAIDYAKSFLVQKYRKEYQELYDAYLSNRGVKIRRSRSLSDEREKIRG